VQLEGKTLGAARVRVIPKVEGKGSVFLGSKKPARNDGGGSLVANLSARLDDFVGKRWF